MARARIKRVSGGYIVQVRAWDGTWFSITALPLQWDDAVTYWFRVLEG